MDKKNKTSIETIRLYAILIFSTIFILSSIYSYSRYLKLSEVETKVEDKTTLQEEVKSEKSVVKEKSVLGVVEVSVTTPSQIKLLSYEVPKDHPRQIEISKLKTTGFIQSVGIDQYKKIAVPSNIYMAGWYIHSVKPGEKGISIIDGHRDGVFAKGVFYGIENLNKGDTIKIVYGDGRSVKFQVVRTIVVDEDNAKDKIFSKDPKIEEQLNLVSCLGTFDSSNRTYDKRVIVVTKRIN